MYEGYTSGRQNRPTLAANYIIAKRVSPMKSIKRGPVLDIDDSWVMVGDA